MPSPAIPSRLHPLRRKLVAAATVVALAALGTTVAETTGATAAPAAGHAQAKAVHTVTLITGDRVTVTTLADGTQTGEVDRPGNATGGVRVQQIGGDIIVLPDEVLPHLEAGRLDRRLFNVTDLIEMGYDDAKTAELPLIATFEPAKTRGAKPAAPRGTRLVRELSSVGGAALRADKKQAHSFWNGGSALDTAGMRKIWLDGRVKANLKESVPMVGAPEAWAAGYTGTGVKVAVLDTGIDATHPDLAAQIDDKVSFVPGEDTTDINGHGTHVASTIVGTGAGASGQYKGVAPGADLIVGKVLGGPQGYGEDSWVIAGMQWAAESGADVVNMSLGNDVPSDGSDPMSAAVDALTAQYGTLFVIAAGNSGPETIAAPGAAASALTVGATDKQDQLAYFSSTGPLVGSGAIKPDLSAPGVDITAARSQQMPTGEGLYRSISGTSMATPHVAGAAAILLQRHPDWSAQRVKDALTSSSKALADFYTPYEVGAGRLDVASALRNTVHANGSLFFGNFDWPHEPSDAPVAKPLTFTNSGTADVTLNLAVTGDGPFSLGAPSVTVPAGGSAAVQVTGDPTAAAYGRLTGYVVATDAATGAALTRTALGLVKEDERYNLTIKLIDRDGKPAKGNVVLNQAGSFWPYIVTVDGQATLRMPPGMYTHVAALDIRGERPDSLGLATLVDPETILDKHTEVVLDARKARLLDTAAPQRSENRQRKVDFKVTYADGGRPLRDTLLVPVKYDDLYVMPTEPMTKGTFEVATRWRAGEETLSLDVFGLLPVKAQVQPGSTVTAGKQTLKAVYARAGASGDYSKVDAKGKAVVVERTDAVTPEDRTAAAVAAGAALLVVVHDGVGILNEYVGESPIPVVTVHRDAGALLVWLAKTGVAKFAAKQVPYARFVYDLTRNYRGSVPDQPLVYKPSQRELARIDANYFNAAARQEGGGYRWDMTFTPSFGFRERELYPNTRTEWVTPDQMWHEGHELPNGYTDNSYHDTYARGSRKTLNWFAPAIRPAFTRAFAVQNGRYRDYVTINVQAWSSSGNDGLEHGGNLEWGAYPTNMKLYQGGTLIDENEWSSSLQWTEVPSGRLPYRLVLDASRPAEEFRLSTRTHTEWEFVSETTGNVKSVSLDVSYDDGATWRSVNLTKGADGRWSADLRLDGAAGGFVSLRAAAQTDTGWAIRQEVIRAYGLS